MENKVITIWVVDDNRGDLLLLQELLIELDYRSANIQTFYSIADVLAASEKMKPDVLLLDLFLQETRGIETFKSVVELQLNCPVIVLSGISDMETAIETVKLGAQDFLIKDELSAETIDRMIHYSIERHLNIDSLKRSEEKYKHLFRSIPIAMILLDSDLNIVELNTNASHILGEKAEKDTAYKFIFNDNKVADRAVEAIRTERVVLLKINVDDEVVYLEQHATRSSISNEESYIVSLVDRTAAMIGEMNKAKIVQETLDDERHRFSKELHDGLAQYLVALNLQLEMIKGIDGVVDATLEKGQEVITTSLKIVRTMSYNLSPPDLEKGLIPALEAFFNRLQNVNNVQFIFNVKCADTDCFTSFIDEYSVFRILQEFVNNSFKYSGCSKIFCDIALQDESIQIVIRDNGVGFATNDVAKGLGLRNMKQRAAAADLTFDFTSVSGEGTQLTLSTNSL
jgi:two-component system sensor histidine kinase UhpB